MNQFEREKIEDDLISIREYISIKVEKMKRTKATLDYLETTSDYYHIQLKKYGQLEEELINALAKYEHCWEKMKNYSPVLETLERMM